MSAPTIHPNCATEAVIRKLTAQASWKTPEIDAQKIRDWAVGVDRSEVYAKLDWLKSLPYAGR